MTFYAILLKVELKKRLIFKNDFDIIKDMDDLKQIIAENIVFYRKEIGLTQVELAEKLNYSDKAISKWERAESCPDIITLVSLAKIFNVTVNELVEDRKKVKRVKPLIALLSSGLVWLIATAAYVILNMIIPTPKSWLSFVYAVPVCTIVLLVFFAVWDKKLLVLIAESVLMWTIAVCIFLTIPSSPTDFYIFFLPIPLQLLAILWYELRVKRKTKFNFIRKRVKVKNDKKELDKNGDDKN